MKTELILLAAGQSQRFDGIKQLADIHGQPMICHCLGQYRQNGKWMVGLSGGHVALGANAELIISVLPENINKHVVDSWQNGMGHTLAESMQFLANDSTHVFIGLADQILITQSLILQLLNQASLYPDHIIAAKYAGRVGVPCIFPREYFTRLHQLNGDKGAQIILQKCSQQVISIEMPEASLDIDRQVDLLNLSF